MSDETKMTVKQARAHYSKIYSVGYCWLSMAPASMTRPIAYGSGVYGWNWDLVPIGNGVAICTGYRPFKGERIPADIDAAWRALKKDYYDNSNASTNGGHYDSKKEAEIERRAGELLEELARR